SEAGGFTRSTPESRWTVAPRRTVTSASVRRSENSSRRSVRSAMSRRASSGSGVREGETAVAHAARHRAGRRLLRSLGALTFDPTQAITPLFELLLHRVCVRIE